MFKKRFDHNDINNFLPDNKTIGTFDFYNKKFKNRMPEHISEICSIKALIDDEEVIENKIKEILDKQQEYYDKLLNEYNERYMDTNDENDLNEKMKRQEYYEKLNKKDDDSIITEKINNLVINNE